MLRPSVRGRSSMRRLRLRFVVLVIAAAVVAGAVSQSSYGITFCFDWVAYQINDKKDANDLTADKLRALMRKLGYTRVLQIKATTGPPPAAGIIPFPRASDIKLDVYQFAPPNPKLTKVLKRGDVLIFGNDHTGIVRLPGNPTNQRVEFDHFLQVPGRIGTQYTPAEATKLPNYFVGPKRSWSLREIFALSHELAPAHTDDWTFDYYKERLGRLAFGAPRQYPFLHQTAEVWRRSADLTGWPGTWETSTGGFALHPLYEDDIRIAKEGKDAVQLYDRLASCPGSQYYRGGYVNPNDRGKIMGCGTSTHIVGRWLSNEDGNTGSFDITITPTTDPPKFKGWAQSDGGRRFDWSGTWLSSSGSG